jgi:SAM-dependent methyltransferase
MLLLKRMLREPAPMFPTFREIVADARARDGVAMGMRENAVKDGHFDAAVSAHVVDHLKEHKRRGLAEIRRVLKPGGRFLMVVWVPGWVTFALANVFCFALTTPAGWRKLAADVEFEIRDEGTFNGMWFAVLERAG